MTWAKDPEQDTFRRTDGALVHRMVGDEWAAALPGRHGPVPQVLKSGGRIRTFPGAPAAMGAVDEEFPEKVKEKI